ncbi:MAG: NAD(P)/FAD-dependent oxidoreductase [Pseudomonadota bacterium]
MTEAPRSPGLLRLEAEIARDFARLNHPPADWVPPSRDRTGQRVADVAIVGAGMCGLVAAFGLRRLGISNITHIDGAEPGREGPWVTYARMRTLRSPKHLTGPAQGLPNLTFRAWWEAQDRDWEALDKIERTAWMAYLTWYRDMTGARVENETRLTHILPAAHGVEIQTAGKTGRRRFAARRVILATGREGQAVPRVPAPLQPFMGKTVFHSADPMPAVDGRHVAVVGLAASAFDNAAEALDRGASRVTLIGRSDAIPRLNKMKQTVYPGFTHGFPMLRDEEKLEWLDHVMQHRIAPPRASVQRISQDPRVSLWLRAEVAEAREGPDGLTLATTKGSLTVDTVILGTGFAVDLSVLSNVGDFATDILTWADRVPNAVGEWGAFPYLGDGFEFLAQPGRAVPGLSRVHCFTHAAQLSLGNLSNDIPAVSEGADRLARAIATALFLEDREVHRANLESYADPELLGDEWPGVNAWDPPVR